MEVHGGFYTEIDLSYIYHKKLKRSQKFVEEY